MKLSKCYRKLKLLRDGASFASPESGHYKVERTSIMLPITLADEYNYHWEESGVYYEEIEEIEDIEEIEVEEIEIKKEAPVVEQPTIGRLPSFPEIKAEAKRLGMKLTNKTKKEEMLSYIRKNQKN